jgi:hypothetical protein
LGINTHIALAIHASTLKEEGIRGKAPSSSENSFPAAPSM